MQTHERIVRHALYDAVSRSGRMPGADDLARATGRSPREVRTALDGLARAHLVAWDESSDTIRMAHPFAGGPTDYCAVVDGRRYDANCAWDALAIPALLERDGTVPARCADCGAPLPLEIRDGRVTPAEAMVQFIVPIARFWDDIEDT